MIKLKIKDYADVIYNIVFLCAYLSLVVITLMLGMYGIQTFTYLLTIIVVGLLYFVTEFVKYMQQAKMLFFSNYDARKRQREQ